jgi:hypothetical protein
MHEEARLTGESSIASTFSLVSHSPFQKHLGRFGFSGQNQTTRSILRWVALTWLPLAMLCLSDGTGWGNKVRIPLFRDFSIYGRFFVALPLLVLADLVIDRFVRQVVLIFDSSGILRNDDLIHYRSTLGRVTELLASRLVHMFVVLLAFFPWFLFLAGNEWTSGHISTWHGSGVRGLSPGGWWFVLVGSPVLRFLMLRWLWRFAIWTYLLRKISGLNLNLLAMHPDRLGGLGFLLFAQQRFGLLAAALGSVVAGQFANEIFYLGFPLNAMKAPAGLFVFGSVLVVLLPLVFFSVRLFEARYDGMIRNNQVARLVTDEFDSKWARQIGRPPDQMIGTQDPSSLIDYISSYDVIRETRIIPINKRAVIYITALAAAPFAFVWLLTIPVERLVTEIVRRLF